MKRIAIFAIAALLCVPTLALNLQAPAKAQQQRFNFQFALVQDLTSSAGSIPANLIFDVPSQVGGKLTFTNRTLNGTFSLGGQVGYVMNDDPANPQQGINEDKVLTIERIAFDQVEVWGNLERFYAPANNANLLPRGFGPEFRIRARVYAVQGQPIMQVQNLGTFHGFLQVNNRSGQPETLPDSWKDRNLAGEFWSVPNSDSKVAWGVSGTVPAAAGLPAFATYTVMQVVPGAGQGAGVFNFGVLRASVTL